MEQPRQNEQIHGIQVERVTLTLNDLNLPEKASLKDIRQAVYVKYDTTALPYEADNISRVKILNDSALRNLSRDQIPNGCNLIRVIHIPEMISIGNFVHFDRI